MSFFIFPLSPFLSGSLQYRPEVLYVSEHCVTTLTTKRLYYNKESCINILVLSVEIILYTHVFGKGQD